MKKNLVILVAAILAVAILGAACQATPPPAAPATAVPAAPATVATVETAPSAAGPQRGGTLRIGLEAEPENLDPHFLIQTSSMRVMEQLYSTLLRLDENMDFHPDLATEWQVSEDGTTYTFKLREGVKFCNGRELVADDVKYSIERMADPELGSPWGYLWVDLDKVETPDKYTVGIVMKKPSAQILASLATPWTAIVPKEFVEENGGSLKTVACGTGPFKLVEWVPYQYIKMARNEDYYDPNLPYLDEIDWIPVQDETSRVQQVTAGQLDVDIFGPPKFLSTYEKTEGIQLASGPVCSVVFLGLNASRPPFDDVRVRQAVAWALDRQEILDLAAQGQGTPLTGGIIGPETFWAYADINIYPKPDLDKAKQLLADAGYADGLKVMLVPEASGTIYEDMAQVIKAQLAKVGIDVTINAMEAGAATKAVWETHDFDMTSTHWGTLIDPDDFVYAQFHTGGGWNPFGCSNAELDTQLEKGRAVMDQEERKAIYKEVDQLVADDACYVLLYRPVRYAAMQEGVKGFKHEAGNTRLSLRETWLEKSE